MSNSYLVILKIRQLLSISISKVVIFNNINFAYDYAMNLSYPKEKANTLDDVIKTRVVWKSGKSTLPIYECKIVPIDNDILCNIYQTLPDNEKIIPYIYKELIINEIIDE
jgi:hypothetical protein